MWACLRAAGNDEPTDQRRNTRVLVDEDPHPYRTHDRLEHRDQGDIGCRRSAAPMLNNASPIPSWAKPNVRSTQRGLFVYAGTVNISELIIADSNIAGAMAISEWRRIMTVP